LVILEGSFIGANTLLGLGKGGNLEVTADNGLITGVEKSKDPIGADFTGLTTITGIEGGTGAICG
jgi:hypothetical protein